MSNVPYLLDDDNLIEKLDLPPDVETTGTITREKEKLPEGGFFTGKASMLLNIENEKSENELREWSHKSASGERRFERLDIPFNAHTPALHSCTFCEAENKPHIGHNIAWCRLNKSNRAVNQETKQRLKTNERNSPRRESHHQSTKSHREPRRESNQREQRSPSQESHPCEESSQNNFDPLTFDESEAFSTPEAEFRKQSRTGRRGANRDNNHISPIEAPGRFEVLRKASKLDKNTNEKTKQTEQDHPSISKDNISYNMFMLKKWLSLFRLTVGA